MPTLTGTETLIRVQRLKQWPKGYERTPADARRSSRFESNDIILRTKRELDRELQEVDAENVVLQVEVEAGKIRQRDGLPYKRAEVDPGVVLTFENEDGTHTYPCDTFLQWAENLRAITLALHDLRRITRYGVGHGSEQYRGFTAIPADVDKQMTPEDAAMLLVRTAPATMGVAEPEAAAQRVLADPEALRRVHRSAAKQSHPDRPGVATAAHFDRVQKAKRIIEEYHRRRKEA